MKSEDTIYALHNKAVEAATNGDIDELYVIRTQMMAILKEEENKPLDLHTDRYNGYASLVYLDMFDFPKALEYMEKIKEPTEGILYRIEKTKEDIKTYQEKSDALLANIGMARNCPKHLLTGYLEKMSGLSFKVLPTTYGNTLILIQLLKAEGIMNYRLENYKASVIYFDESRKHMPVDTEIMYYHIKALRFTGQNQRANQLVEYVRRISIDEEIRDILVKL